MGNCLACHQAEELSATNAPAKAADPADAADTQAAVRSKVTRSSTDPRAFFVLRKTEAVTTVYTIAEQLGSGQVGCNAAQVTPSLDRDAHATALTIA